MGKRSRKRRPDPGERTAAPAPSRAARTEAKNQAARAALAPLDRGERPWAVTIGAAICLLFAVGDIVVFAAGVKIQGKTPALASFIATQALLVACAIGMWRMRYWAVLGFQCLLVLTLLGFALLLTRASNVQGVAISLGVLGGGGWLFWKLIKSMARIQMPERPSREGSGR